VERRPIVKLAFWKREEDPETTPLLAAVERCLIVGLGNPGRKYAGNRHNIGHMAVDALARRHGWSLNRSKFSAVFTEERVAGVPVVAVKPLTFMNNSGVAVGQLARFFKVPAERVLIIYDELDLPLGTLRLRQAGGSGGHNGMKSVIQHLGNAFPRLRLGIGRPPGQMPPAAFVLQDFGRSETTLIEVMLQEAVDAVETFVTEGIDRAMSRHNGPVSLDTTD
jgi:PTH1 family peptidyl-tRNA hydrolase